MTPQEEKELLLRVVTKLAGKQLEQEGGFITFGATLGSNRDVRLLMPKSMKQGASVRGRHLGHTQTLIEIFYSPTPRKRDFRKLGFEAVTFQKRDFPGLGLTNRSHSAYGLTDSRSVSRPIDIERLTEDFVLSNRTPVAAVPAMIAIVAQREVRIRRYDEFSLLDMAENLFGPLRLQGWRQFICPDWRKVEKKRIVRRSPIVVGERLILLLSIEIDLMVHNLHAIAGHSDDPFNVSRVVLIRKLENDQIAPLRRMTAIVPCVRNDSIFRSERGKHGCCSNPIGAKSRYPVGNVAPHGEDVD